MRDKSGQIMKLGQKTMDFILFEIGREEPHEASE